MRTRHALILGVLMVGGCGEAPSDVTTTRGAVVYERQYVSVPAYWDPRSAAMGPDFQTLVNWDNGNSRSSIKSVIVNLGCETHGNWDPVTNACLAQPGQRAVAGGPGSLADPDIDVKTQALATYIGSLQRNGIGVFGYVDFYPNRPSLDIKDDIGYHGGAGWRWRLAPYGIELDGIFFDEADRSQSTVSTALARAEFFSNFVNGVFARPTRVIFNYGVTHTWTATLVGCLANYNYFNWFVTQEHTLSMYQGIDRWGEFSTDPNHPGNSAWMNGYVPYHFINIIHDVPHDVAEATIDDVINESRILNAGHVYIKDIAPDPNTYGHLAQNTVQNPGLFPIFDYLYNASVGAAEFDHGGASDPPPGPCVTPDENAPE